MKTIAVFPVALFGFSMCAALNHAFAAMTKIEVASGETFAFTADTNVETVELTVNAGATVNFPASGNVFAFVYMKGSGTVVFQKPAAYSGGDEVVFQRGIAAESTVDAVVNDVSALKVGCASTQYDINYPVVDVASMSFGQPDGRLVLSGKCTARALPQQFEVASGATVALQGENPLRLSGAFEMADYDVVLLSRGALPAGCAVAVRPGRTLSLKPAVSAVRDGNSAYKWNWAGAAATFGEGDFSVALGGKGARVLCRNMGQRLRLFSRVTGEGEVVFRPDAGTGSSSLVFRGITYAATSASPVTMPVDTAAEPPAAEWRGKVASWFDASDESSLVKLSVQDPDARFDGGGMYYTNGFPVIVGWKDAKTGISGAWLCNRRLAQGSPDGSYLYDYQVQTLPYVVTNGLNGMDYVSCGARNGNSNNVVGYPYAKGASAAEARRLQFHSASVACDGAALPDGGDYVTKSFPYCIMVFGSQQGGGKAVLNDIAGEGRGNLARTASTTGHPWTAYDGYGMKVDGIAVAPKTAKPSGGWQVVSLDMSATNTVLGGIGGHRSNEYGGQNYAEIIFFSEVPTPAERVACEAYLAEKWGLGASYSRRAANETFSEVSGGDGASLTIGDYETDDLSPSPLVCTTPEEVTLAGNFRGAVTVSAGKTLVVSGRPAPPAAYDVPRGESIVAWFDPSLDGAVDFHQSAEATNGVARLYSRTADGVDKEDDAYWMGMQAENYGATPGIANKIGRYPFLVSAARSGLSGAAPAMPWMDFTRNAPGDGNGNTLRSHNLPDLDVVQTGASPMAFRSVFMALDTSAGGGSPVGDKVSFDGGIKARAGNGADASKPIWGEGTVAMAHTWLDTAEVDGFAAGYNARGEVLGFETAADFIADAGLFFGYYNPGGGQKNYERIGEAIVYSTALDDEERLAVQKYLMAKWLGDMNGEFTDMSGATVSGAGDLRSASLRNLPRFGEGFSGRVTGGSAMSFKIVAGRGGARVVDAISVDRAVALDADCAVSVTVRGSGRLAAGEYVLLSATALSGGENMSIEVRNETDREIGKCRVWKSADSVSLYVLKSGFKLLVR